MEKSFKISVDTGSIAALLVKDKTKKSIKLKKGKYKLALLVKNCWNGRVENYGFLDVSDNQYLSFGDSGILMINDEDFIREEDLHKIGCTIGTGGDGSFNLYVKITPISRIGSDPYLKKLKLAKDFFKKRKYNEDSSKEFVKLFMSNCYYPSISDILDKERSKEMKKLLKSAEDFLKKIKTSKK